MVNRTVPADSPTCEKTHLSILSSKSHLSGVDALRGWAALYVVLYHLPIVPQPNLLIPDCARHIVLQGGSAVALFFVISAFTLMLSMRKRGAGRKELLSFYLRRVFRVAPLYYLWLILTLLRQHFPGWEHLNWTHPGASFWLCLSFGYNLVPGQSEGMVWASWTLGVEMLFYLAFPFLFRYVSTLARAVGFFLGSVLAAYAFRATLEHLALPTTLSNDFYYFSLLHSLPLFAAGMVAFFIYERWIENRALPPRIGMYLIALSGVTLVVLAYMTDAANYQVKALWLEKWYWFAFAYGFLMLGLTILPVRSLVNPLTRFFGTISYSMYLNHMSVVFLLAPVYRYLYTQLPSDEAAFTACLFLTLLALTPLSWLTYHYVEQPFMALGNRAIARLSARSKPRLGWLKIKPSLTAKSPLKLG